MKVMNDLLDNVRLTTLGGYKLSISNIEELDAEKVKALDDIKKHAIMNDLVSARDRVLDLCSQDGWPDEPIDPQLWAAAQKIIAASAFWHNIAAGIEIENIVLERSDAAAPEEPDHNVRAGFRWRRKKKVSS